VLDDRVSIPDIVMEGISSLCRRVQTSPGSHSASYPIGTGGSFPGTKRPERETDHSFKSSAKVKSVWKDMFRHLSLKRDA
jgi:hypothetical protein